jgi:hypothetical protein
MLLSLSIHVKKMAAHFHTVPFIKKASHGNSTNLPYRIRHGRTFSAMAVVESVNQMFIQNIYPTFLGCNFGTRGSKNHALSILHCQTDILPQVGR